MPELPEVQTVCNDLIKAGVVGKTILKAKVSWPRIIEGSKTKYFLQNISDKKIIGVQRRAKYIHLLLSDNFHLLIHLRMSGRLSINETRQAPSKHEHVILFLDDHAEIRYHDTRKFGRWLLTQSPESIFNKLGVEPLSTAFTEKWLTENLKNKKKQIKPLLLDQSFIAGIGNIYADESLFLGRIHPETIACNIPTEKIRLLHKGIIQSLKTGLKNNGTTLGNSESNFYSVAKRKGRNKDQLNVFRRQDQPCPICQTTITRLIVAQRSTHICPKCQS